MICYHKWRLSKLYVQHFPREFASSMMNTASVGVGRQSMWADSRASTSILYGPDFLPTPTDQPCSIGADSPPPLSHSTLLYGKSFIYIYVRRTKNSCNGWMLPRNLNCYIGISQDPVAPPGGIDKYCTYKYCNSRACIGKSWSVAGRDAGSNMWGKTDRRTSRQHAGGQTTIERQADDRQVGIESRRDEQICR